MNNVWTHKGIGGTAGTILGLIAFGSLSQLYAIDERPANSPTKFSGKRESSTAGSHRGPLSGTYSVVRQAPVEAQAAQVAQAYERFAAQQRPLDPEFATILAANLWDLYER